MKQNIIHIGLAADDKQYHGSALYQTSGEVLVFVRIRTSVSSSGKIDFTNAITILLTQTREPMTCLISSAFELLPYLP